jgi:hypothetical protein
MDLMDQMHLFHRLQNLPDLTVLVDLFDLDYQMDLVVLVDQLLINQEIRVDLVGPVDPVVPMDLLNHQQMLLSLLDQV